MDEIEYHKCRVCLIPLTPGTRTPGLERDNQHICTKCHATKQRNYRAANRERTRATSREYYSRVWKTKRLLNTYGLTEDEYSSMLKSQNDQCAICNIVFSEDTRNTTPCVDHDHETGRIRGILCHKCNVGLGNLDDSIERLLSAIEYLK